MAKNASSTGATQRQKSAAKANKSLHIWNRWFSGIYVVQGILFTLLASERLYPVQTSYLTPDYISSEISNNPVVDQAVTQIFDINLMHLVVGSFLVAAATHAVVATIYRGQYETELKRRLNTFRWIEYAITGAFLVTAVGLATGITDLATLLSIFMATAIAALAGLAMETSRGVDRQPSWLVYGIGGLASLLPAAVFAVYAWSTTIYGSASVPGFVYGLYATLAVFGVGIAANMYLQSKQRGKWRDYYYAERLYLLLSIAAKSALVWQLYAGALRP